MKKTVCQQDAALVTLRLLKTHPQQIFIHGAKHAVLVFLFPLAPLYQKVVLLIQLPPEQNVKTFNAIWKLAVRLLVFLWTLVRLSFQPELGNTPEKG